MHHKVKSGWEFDIALKKRSPFRLFSTLDVSYNKNERFLCYINDNTQALQSSRSPPSFFPPCQFGQITRLWEHCVVKWWTRLEKLLLELGVHLHRVFFFFLLIYSSTSLLSWENCFCFGRQNFTPSFSLICFAQFLDAHGIMIVIWTHQH